MWKGLKKGCSFFAHQGYLYISLWNKDVPKKLFKNLQMFKFKHIIYPKEQDNNKVAEEWQHIDSSVYKNIDIVYYKYLFWQHYETLSGKIMELPFFLLVPATPLDGNLITSISIPFCNFCFALTLSPQTQLITLDYFPDRIRQFSTDWQYSQEGWQCLNPP